MNLNIIRILLISIVAVLIKVIIRNIKNLRKSNVSILTSEQLEYNDILDYIIDLCIYFHNNNRKKYTSQQMVVISSMEYHNEMMNGGLCQFFANSSRTFAPILSRSLEEINAKKHKIHFDKFVKQNKININDLNSFISEDVDEFINQYDRYPFEDFDDEFYDIDETEKLCDLIIEYARNNFNEIFTDIKK